MDCAHIFQNEWLGSRTGSCTAVAREKLKKEIVVIFLLIDPNCIVCFFFSDSSSMSEREVSFEGYGEAEHTENGMLNESEARYGRY